MNRLRQIFVALLLFPSLVALAAGDANDALRAMVGSAAIDSASSAVILIDLEGDSIVAGHNVDRPLVPASIMKTVTIATLLDKVGIDYRYKTEVFTEGKIAEGVLEGNIVVKGSGDPSLNASTGPESGNIISEIVHALRDKNITSVVGDIIIDEEDFSGPSVPQSWAAGDLSQSYGTGSHALNFENNASGKSAVRNPSAVFSARLRSAIRRAGIRIGDSPLPEGGKRKILTEHLSAPVDEIMRSCMMRSDNLFAEAMLRTLSKENGGDGSTADGAKRESNFWRKKDLKIDDTVIIDGSGLSRSNRVTAEFIAGVLQEMSDNVDYASFFPLAGQEGTLRKFLASTPLDSYIALKTGSMNGIQCYAGYKLDDEYAPTHVVVVILNSLPRGRQEAREAVEKFLLECFSPATNDE